MTQDKKHKVVLVDDHTLFRKGIAELVNNFRNYEVIWEAANGREFLDNLQIQAQPEIVILDIAMPEMDGFQTSQNLKRKYPAIKILILSMLDNEDIIIKMLRTGVHGYILKDAAPDEFNRALNEIVEKGSYYSDFVTETMANNLVSDKGNLPVPLNADIEFTDCEKQFLELACTELTYKEIADKMFISFRSADHYRDSLFTKLNVKSRVGLVVYAIKNGYYIA